MYDITLHVAKAYFTVVQLTTTGTRLSGQTRHHTCTSYKYGQGSWQDFRKGGQNEEGSVRKIV